MVGSRIELHVCCLGIPVVSQGVVCFHSVGLGCSWTFTVIIFNDQRGSTLFVSMYISFAYTAHDEKLSLQFYQLFVFIIVSS
jgi:hypothetical protein